MTVVELGQILRKMYNEAEKGMQVASIHLFGIMYAPQIIDRFTVREILIASGLNITYVTELNKGVNTYKLIRSGRYPIKIDLP